MKAWLGAMLDVEHSLIDIQSAHNIYYKQELTHFNWILLFLMCGYGIS